MITIRAMKYRVVIKKKAQKGIRKMPVNVQKRMGFLIDDLKEKGPAAHYWPNYSKLSNSEYPLSSIPRMGGVLAHGRGNHRNRGVLCRLS